MAEWAISDVLPPIQTQAPALHERKDVRGYSDQQPQPAYSGLQHNVRTSFSRRPPAQRKARSPRKQLSPKVRQAIRNARRRSPAASRSKHEIHSAKRFVTKALSMTALQKARGVASDAPLAISRYIDEASPVRRASPQAYKKRAQTSPTLYRQRNMRKKKSKKKKKSTQLVGVTKKAYWKAWNSFQRDQSDPRVAVPLGLGDDAEDFVRRSFKSVLRSCPPAARRDRAIPQQAVNDVLELLGISAIGRPQLHQLVQGTRHLRSLRRATLEDSSSDDSSEENTPHDDGFTADQLVACFVTFVPSGRGGFNPAPLSNACQLRAAGRSPVADRPHSSKGDSSVGKLPPIVSAARSPVRTAPTRMRTRPQQSQPRTQKVGSDGRVIVRSAAASRLPQFRSYGKFKKLHDNDVRSGNLVRASGRGASWSMAKGNFVRTGDKSVTQRSFLVYTSKFIV